MSCTLASRRPRVARVAVLALSLVLLTAVASHAASLSAQPKRPGASSAARAQSSAALDPSWVGYPLPNVPTTVQAMIPFAGGVVAGGNGTYWGTTLARRIALFDGIGWQPLGDGLPMQVNALALYGGQLIAAGTGGFSDVPGLNEQPAIFRWDGTAWTSFGNVNGSVLAMAVLGTDLYVGGTIQSIDGVQRNKIARWDGSAWHSVGSGLGVGTFSSVKALAVHGGNLVAGGNLSGFQGVAQWNGLGWTSLGSGLQSGAFAATVNALVSNGATLYASGNFTSSGGLPITRVAEWNGSVWTGLPTATFASEALTTYGGFLMATVPDAGANRPQLWSGTTWQAFNHPNVRPLAYALRGGTLFAAGNLSTAVAGPTPVTIDPIQMFDGGIWTPVQQPWAGGMLGLNGATGSAAEWQGALYVGGSFGFVGTGTNFLASTGVARWDGAAWSALGAGASAQDLEVWNDSLVAAVGADVKVWNGSTWRKLAAPPATGSTFDVLLGLRLLVHQGELYALSPNALFPGATPLRGLARWTGSTWVPVGNGLEDYAYVFCGTTWGSSLVVGGIFYTADGQVVRNLAAWDGNAYHPIGGGVDDQALAVLADGADLIVGGQFRQAGSESLTAIARWDGSQWHAMGHEATRVTSLSRRAGYLYATGRFIDPTLGEVGGVAVWTGTRWQLLGSGVDSFGTANGAAFLGDDLYLLGGFGLANGQVARNFARLPGGGRLGVEPPVPPAPPASRLALAPSPNPARGRVRFAVTLPVAGRARLAIHDVSGREVARLLDGEHAAGTFSLAWEGDAAPGLYFATLDGAGGRVTTRVVRLE